MIEPTYFDATAVAFAYLSYYTHLLGVVGCARYMVSAIFFGFERVRPLLFRASLLFTASEDIRVGVRSPLGAHISCQGTPQVPFDPHYGLRCPRLLTLCPPHVSGAPQGSTELSSPQRRPSARSDPPTSSGVHAAVRATERPERRKWGGAEPPPSLLGDAKGGTMCIEQYAYIFVILMHVLQSKYYCC